jgi:1,4-dihydroxy-2-naphthoate octaprenyltransferase
MTLGILSHGLPHKVGAQARLWFIEIRPMFLIGSVVVAFLGTSIAWADGFFSLIDAVLAFIGLVLWHISVQVLNDYFDFKSGVDLRTQMTPFTGGSGILPANLLKAEAVFKFGLLSFALAAPIWIYFIIDKGLLLLPVLAVQAICILLYTPYLVRWKLGEIACGVGLGIIPVLEFYFVQTGGYTTQALVAATLSGILFFNIHLLNNFPDVEADKFGGRKTLPIVLGRKKAAWLFLGGTIVAYTWILACVAVEVMPPAALLCLISMPFALWAIRGAFNYRSVASFTPSLWANALFPIVTLIILASSYIIDHI